MARWTVGPTDDRCAGGEPHLQRCLDGDCENSEAVVEALMEVGGWDEIDGDGTNATVLADHVRRLVPKRDEPTAEDVGDWLVDNRWSARLMLVGGGHTWTWADVLDARAALIQETGR